MTKNLLGLSKSALTTLVQSLGHPAYHAQTLFNHLHHHQHLEQRVDWPQIKSLPASLREALQAAGFHLDRGSLLHEAMAADGTRKSLLSLAGSTVECVMIPEGEGGRRRTVCVSSQVGCSLACRFCHTGTQPLERNLTAADILAQFDHYRLSEDLGKEGGDTKWNVVFMGQGEPLLNWRAVMEAGQIMLDRGMHPERITISTSGIAPAIAKVARLGVHLAISLHAPTDTLRTRLMSINRTYPLSPLIAACREYQQTVSSPALRRITFEYVMLDNVNDNPSQQPRELANLLRGIPALINLIPFNPWPGSLFLPTPPERVEEFRRALQAYGLTATIRRPRGQDIMAACGQLRAFKSP